MEKITQKIRQLGFPSVLRIEDPGGVLQELTPDTIQFLIHGPTDSGSSELDEKFAINLATTAWRLHKQTEKIDGSGTARALKNRTNALLKILSEKEIEIKDYTGEVFDENDLWDEVIGTGNQVGKLLITGMQAPRVKLNGAVIQRGVVIVDSK